MRPFSELVAIGRVVKPQGRKGELLAEPLTDRPDRFPSLRKVLVGTPGGDAVEMRVTACWPHKDRYVLKLDGIDSIDAAERLRGRDLGIGEEELAALPDGSYYFHQLIGMEVEDESRHGVGRVADVLETGASPVLAVAGAAGETLIPFAMPFIREVDLAERRLRVRMPQEAA